MQGKKAKLLVNDIFPYFPKKKKIKFFQNRLPMMVGYKLPQDDLLYLVKYFDSLSETILIQ